MKNQNKKLDLTNNELHEQSLTKTELGANTIKCRFKTNLLKHLKINLIQFNKSKSV